MNGGHGSDTDARDKLQALVSNLTAVIRGKQESLDIVVVALLANGSILMEDVPGVGKTTLAKALARSIDVTFHRVQFTPDLLPGDILGSSIYNPVDGTFNFRRGPIFCNVLLGDEINRASPRTQSALLEAMGEMQATIEGRTHPLPTPFLVIATQNPIEFHGTYPLPEAQLDRFLVHLSLGYPDSDSEIDMVYSQQHHHPIEDLEPVLTGTEILDLQQQVLEVEVERSVADYVVELAQVSRRDSRLKLGVSPRGTLMLFRASQAEAFLRGRTFVIPEDVQRLAPYVLSHRIMLTSKARYSSVTKDAIIGDLLNQVRVPT